MVFFFDDLLFLGVFDKEIKLIVLGIDPTRMVDGKGGIYSI